jgi:hypothetical protein
MSVLGEEELPQSHISAPLMLAEEEDTEIFAQFHYVYCIIVANFLQSRHFCQLLIIQRCQRYIPMGKQTHEQDIPL